MGSEALGLSEKAPESDDEASEGTPVEDPSEVSEVLLAEPGPPVFPLVTVSEDEAPCEVERLCSDGAPEVLEAPEPEEVLGAEVD